VKSKKSCSALTIGELIILVVVVIVFIALLPPAISLVRKRGRQINDVSNGKRVAAALRYFAGVGASPATTERPPSRFVITTRSVSLGTEELPPGTQLELVSNDGSIEYVRYGGGEYGIPISATDLK